MENRFFKATISAAFMIFASPAISADQGDILIGKARVIDGDTIEVSNVRIRLNGVAAPELKENGGKDSARFLVNALGAKSIKCSLSGERTYNREVGVCWLGNIDVGALIIASGHARDCPRYSKARYAALEPPEARKLPLPRYCLPK